MQKSLPVLTAAAALLALAALSCQKKESPSGRDAAASSAAAASAPVDTVGEFDPIANSAAVPGGSYTTWGSSFPKSINMWLEYTSFSAELMGLLFEDLATLHSTEDRAVGNLAQSWEISPDGRTFTFRIDPRARWSDGRPVTARDVQFYYDVIMDPKNMTPIFRVGLSRFGRPEAPDSLTVKITAREAHWANFWEAAGLRAFPAHAWEGKDFNAIHFDFPVVSGPYALDEVKKERFLTLKRREEWWGRSKRYNQHKYNFGSIKYRFMEDRHKALEAFKKGDFDAYAVYTAQIWVEKTDFDQVKKGWVSKRRVYNREPKGYQGFAINLRRPLLQDLRVRQALCHLLNRELMNDKLMYHQYFLLNSYYPDLHPDNRNPAVPLLEYDPEKARRLLAEAGWTPGPDGILAKDGKRFEITLPTASADLRHYNVYLEDLKKAGIRARIEQISHSSLSKRIDDHDFDLHWSAWGAGRLRDPEAAWHSSTADQKASNNYPGLKDSVVDALIQAQKTEMDLGKRNALLRRLDTRLAEITPYVLLWQSDHTRLLHWNRFGTPKYVLDKFNREDAIIPYWYVDPEKEKALAEARKAGRSLPADTGAVKYED